MCGVGLALGLVLAGCGGGGGDANKILSETASNLGEIRSGTLSMKLRVDPQGEAGGEPFGFELEGPFALRREGLPVARVAYTRTIGDRRATVTVISTGKRAFVEVNGRTYELPASETESLRSTGGALGGGGELERLAIDDWVEKPEASDGGEVGGDETDKVEARLDVVDATNGLIELARRIGRADLSRLEGKSAKQLEDSVESSSFELWTGEDDRLLRRLKIEAKLGFDVPDVLRETFGDVVGAEILFELGVEKPNEPVHVAEPENVRPYSELPSG